MSRFKGIQLLIGSSMLALSLQAQDVSFIALGDMHYDRLGDHDVDFVMSRPQDYEQIFKEYPQYTAFFMPKFLQLIKRQAATLQPPVKAVVQLGDLTEGVSGSLQLGRQMNRGVVDLLSSVQMPIPWVLVKGNHDVSNSPGQPEAWEEVIRPFMEGQLKKPVGHGMYTYKLNKKTELFVLDQFFSNDRNVPETEMVDFLEKELQQSTATYKFVLTHQPVIPVTQRCWHLLSGIRRPVKDSALRDRFLNLLAKHKVIVLAAHLHQYSVVSRQTDSGTVVQVMINSVNKGLDAPLPKKVITQYKGGGFIDDDPQWQPSTQLVRRKILEEEKKHVKQFWMADLPGYALISVDDKNGQVVLNYYNGFAEVPYQTVSLTALQEDKPVEMKMPLQGDRK
jgi:hypothetical protein